MPRNGEKFRVVPVPLCRPGKSSPYCNVTVKTFPIKFRIPIFVRVLTTNERD